MKIKLFLLFLIVLTISCSDDKKTDAEAGSDSDFTNEIKEADNDAAEDPLDEDKGGTYQDKDPGTDETMDEEPSVQEHSPGGIGVTAGGGRAVSENYRFQINVGAPLSGGVAESDSYKLRITFK